MPKKQKMASNQKMHENKPTLKFNFTYEYVWPVLILCVFCSDGPNQRTLLLSLKGHNPAFGKETFLVIYRFTFQKKSRLRWKNGDRLHPLSTGIPDQRLADDGTQPVQESKAAESYQVYDGDDLWFMIMTIQSFMYQRSSRFHACDRKSRK